MILPRKLPRKLRRKLGKKTREVILDALEKTPDLTNKELAEICGISIDGIKYQIKQMRSLGMIRRIGPDKGGHWEVIK